MVYKGEVSNGLKALSPTTQREGEGKTIQKGRISGGGRKGKRRKKKSNCFLRPSNGNVELLNDHLREKGRRSRETAWNRDLAPTPSKQVRP